MSGAWAHRSGAAPFCAAGCCATLIGGGGSGGGSSRTGNHNKQALSITSSLIKWTGNIAYLAAPSRAWHSKLHARICMLMLSMEFHLWERHSLTK